MQDENFSTQLREGKISLKGGSDVQSVSIASFRVGTWWSPMVGSKPTPTKLSEHVTKLMHMAPDAESLNRWADTMKDPII